MDIRTLNIPPELKREIEDFAAEVERRNRGEIAEDDFKRFRLQQGIYGQRQDGEQMVRTKLPFGRITADQLEGLADFADNYSNGILHVTTRQDIQFHFVNINDVPKGLQDLAERGLHTREACGNTVRNVTACHKAGTCANEYFDVSPYAGAVSRFLLRHPLTQNLPRKFKISFGGCNGCGLAPIHDIGLNAVARRENGKETRGFRVSIGGGLGSSPHAAQLLTEFMSADNLLRMCEAVVRVFDKHGDKKNRNKARFKFVVDKLGIEQVKKFYEQEFAALKNTQYREIEIPEERIPALPKIAPDRSRDSDPEFKNWKVRNTVKQKQAGFYNAQLKLLLGDLTSAQARALSKIVSSYAAGYVVNTVNQNMMVPWVREEAFGPIFGELRKVGLHKAGTEQLRDITCCPGSETCNLGITASRGLAHHLSADLENNSTASADLDQVSIKVSGCPNSCGQHHIASIGFHGSAKKINGVLAPHYEMMLGGRISEQGAVFGTVVTKMPAKNVPIAVKRVTENYLKEKLEGESFAAFFDRKGKMHFAAFLEDLKDLPPVEQAPESYVDFGSDKKFTLEDRGQGECAGAVTDMIQDHLSVAERALFQGKLAMEKSSFAEATQQANRSLVAAARALLVTEGIDFSDDVESLKKFESLIVDTGIVSEAFSGITSRFQADSAKADAAKSQSRLNEADKLVEDCKKAYHKMQGDKSLRIRVGSNGNHGESKTGAKTAGEAGAASQKIDLLGVKCPFNYVKTKLKLETMASGQRLEVLLDDGDPVKNVPRSIQNDGHKLLSLDKVENHYKMVIEKA
ncbi:MAG: sulfurtransferase TusA family protein [Nitrospinae bacterium]|nr:sulfurtransferase TusA family protein [Nitrospinota bacterium]